MPEMVASHSSQRFAALLDFQRDVDLMNPSHIGKNYSASGHVRRTHHGGDNSWQQNWWDSLSSFLSSTKFKVSKLEAVAPSPPRPFGVDAVVVTGHFSPQKLFIRNALKRALFSRGDESSHVKRARTRNFDYVGYGSNPAMVLCG